jgi:hypothetical protein
VLAPPSRAPRAVVQPSRSNASDIDVACGVSPGTFALLTASNGLVQPFCVNNATFARVNGAVTSNTSNQRAVVLTVETLSNASDYSNLTIDWMIVADRLLTVPASALPAAWSNLLNAQTGAAVHEY